MYSSSIKKKIVSLIFAQKPADLFWLTQKKIPWKTARLHYLLHLMLKQPYQHLNILNITGRCSAELSHSILFYRGNIVIKDKTFYASAKDPALIYDKLNTLFLLWKVTNNYVSWKA